MSRQWISDLVNQTDKFDDVVLKSIKPVDSWVFEPTWWKVREIVRKISEGSAFKKSAAPRQIEEQIEHFKMPSTDLFQAWKT